MANILEEGPIRKLLREKRLLKRSPEEVITPRELRGLVAAMTQAIEASTFRLKEHLRTGLPLDKELIRKEFEAINRIAESTLVDLERTIPR